MNEFRIMQKNLKVFFTLKQKRAVNFRLQLVLKSIYSPNLVLVIVFFY
jgi:hypothetical protein